MIRTALLALLSATSWAQVQPAAPTITPGQPLPAQTMPGQTTPGIVPPSGIPANVPNTNVVDDSKFLKEAAEDCMLQVELGKLAAQKASAADVKQLAQRVADDHSNTNTQLKEAAAKLSIDVPAALDSKRRARLRKLSKLSGTRFDEAYLQTEIDGHEADIKHFGAEKERGTAPVIMAFAAATLPKLQEHLDLVKALKSSTKNQ